MCKNSHHPAKGATAPLHGWLLFYGSADTTGTPRLQVNDGAGTAQVFGVDVTDWQPGTTRAVDAAAFGYPLASLGELKPGRYRVQALLNRYERFTRPDGHTVPLPPDRGDGQQMNAKPGNLYSAPIPVTIRSKGRIALALSEEIGAVPQPTARETAYARSYNTT